MEKNEPSTSTQDNNLGKRYRPKVVYVYKTKVKESPPSVPYKPRHDYFKKTEKVYVTKAPSDSENISIVTTPSPPSLSSDLEDEHGYPGLGGTDVAATSPAIPESSIREVPSNFYHTISLLIKPLNTQIAQKAVPQALKRKQVAVDADNIIYIYKRTCQTNQNLPGSSSAAADSYEIHDVTRPKSNIMNQEDNQPDNFSAKTTDDSNAVFSHTHSPHDGLNEYVQSPTSSDLVIYSPHDGPHECEQSPEVSSSTDTSFEDHEAFNSYETQEKNLLRSKFELLEHQIKMDFDQLENRKKELVLKKKFEVQELDKKLKRKREKFMKKLK